MLNKKVKILWQMFVISSLVILLDIWAGYLQMPIIRSNVLDFVELFLPLVAVLLHAFWTLSFWRGSLIFSLAFLIGLFFEILGVNFGTAFGSYYFYTISGPAIFGVPLIVAFYWAVFIYTGYSLTNSFLYWLNLQLPNFESKNWRQILILTILDGLFVVAIDLFMDPIMVKWQMWSWSEGGAYFNIPLENFTGWFLVTIMATGLFRLFQYVCPKPCRLPRDIYLIPVLGYVLIYLALLIFSLNLKMWNLSLIGTLVMLPMILLNLFLYFRWNRDLSRIR